MRRLLCVLLLTAFGMPFVAPLLASAQGAEAWLPACCRRAGKHHCAMGIAGSAVAGADGQGPSWTALQAKCPCCPDMARVFSHHNLAVAASGGSVAFLNFARPLGMAQTESRRRIARERSRHKRGPPSFSPA